MGLFKRRPNTLVPAEVLRLLPAYGEAVLRARRAGRPLIDERFDWSNFVGPVHMILMSGDRDRAIEELSQAAAAAPDRDLATLGAYRLIAEFNGQLDDSRFLRLYDASLEYLRASGLSSGQLTGHEAQRWVATHGELRSSFDGIVEVAVPDAAMAPPAKPLAVGEARMLALIGPLPEGNACFAEHRDDGRFAIFMEGPWSVDDPRRVRVDQPAMGVFASLPELLRALGARLGTPPYWVDEDLAPYFPQRRLPSERNG
jgi:hypothetical protein